MLSYWGKRKIVYIYIYMFGMCIFCIYILPTAMESGFFQLWGMESGWCRLCFQPFSRAQLLELWYGFLEALL